MLKNDVVTEFVEAGYQISPDALEMITSHKMPEELARYVLSVADESILVIDAEHIDIDGFEKNGRYTGSVNDDGLRVPIASVASETSLSRNMKLPLSSGSCKKHVDILFDITDRSTCVGEYMEFVQYFRDRYSRLSEIIRSRINARPIESLRRNRSGFGRNERYEEVSVIGMVSDLKTTTNGHRLIELEDPTGSFSALVRVNDKELFEQVSRLILDEVIGISGVLTNDSKLLIANKITFPELPNSGSCRNWTQGKAVFISDIHIGSSTFLEDAWERFIDFLNGRSDNEKLSEISRDIRYLLVAGDVVDGVGIFPGQENELSIKDVYEQYRVAGKYFSQIPEDIQVVISPGNHDAVRQAEPQPKLPEKIRSFFPDHITFVGNPALLNLEGVKVLMYHGRSIDDMVAAVPGVSYQNPTTAMVEMMRKRHISPIYGSRVSIAPEKNDHFVIEQVPDIVHCGHVHTVGAERYRNVVLINSGTWQAQTEFQKRVNLIPNPARVPVVDLSDFKTSILKFN